MSLATGTRLDPYEIREPIGVGGMGEVYRAWDTRLQRAVAIKTSKESFTDRFAREARAVAALNHPNICTIHDVGSDYLVMELVEGPTLAERIKRGAVPWHEALHIAKQIAEALEAAHDKGIVHRDLKPANVKTKSDGVVKVLDFGLAKMTEKTTPADNAERFSTLTLEPGTKAGVILGTTAYMAPEQARGEPVDRRADVWAFGAILYELLTGKNLFGRATTSETVAAVLTQDPAWGQLPVQTPPSIRRLLRRCLERDQKRRLPDIGTSRMEIDDAFSGPAPEDGAPPQRQLIPWITLAGVIAISSVLIWRNTHPAPEHRVPARYSILPPKGVERILSPTISPDGRTLAFGALKDGKSSIWVRPVDGLDARPLAGTESTSRSSIDSLVWSPDNRWLAFLKDDTLMRIEIKGGQVRRICSTPTAVSRVVDWSSEGGILFQRNQDIFHVARDGGDPVLFPPPDKTRYRGVAASRFLPDGRRFLFWLVGKKPEDSALMLGIWSSEGGRTDARSIPFTGWFPQYLPGSPGRLLFIGQDALLNVQSFDLERFRLEGDPIVLAPQPVGRFSVSAQGAIYLVLNYSYNALKAAWRNRDGVEIGQVFDPSIGMFSPMLWANNTVGNSYPGSALSHDGSKYAISLIPGSQGGLELPRFINPKPDIWVKDLKAGSLARLTFNENAFAPIWSSDDKWIVYGSSQGLVRRLADGTGPIERLSQVSRATPTDASQDGRFLLFRAHNSKNKFELRILRMTEDRGDFPFQDTEYNGRFSPDGRFIAYESDETGNNEVYVRAFSGTSDPVPGKWQISSGGGWNPHWRADGKELFYLYGSKLLAIGLKTSGSALQPSVPRVLFEVPSILGYDPAPDGRRFLLFTDVDIQQGAQPFTVLLNW